MNLVIVPTCNEVLRIRPLVAELLAACSEDVHLLFVDDSNDGTRNELTQVIALHPKRIFSILRDTRQGLGAAYLDGFSWAIDRQYEKIIQMDADGSHPVSLLPEIFTALDHVPMVCASRYVPQGAADGLSLPRAGLSRSACLFTRTLLDLAIYDITGGFNGWRLSLLQTLTGHSFFARGFAFQIELKYLALTSGAKFIECPMCFAPRQAGRSKLQASHLWEAIRLLFVLFRHRLTG